MKFEEAVSSLIKAKEKESDAKEQIAKLRNRLYDDDVKTPDVVESLADLNGRLLTQAEIEADIAAAESSALSQARALVKSAEDEVGPFIPRNNVWVGVKTPEFPHLAYVARYLYSGLPRIQLWVNSTAPHYHPSDIR